MAQLLGCPPPIWKTRWSPCLLMSVRPDLAVVVLWRMNQQMKQNSLCLSLSFSLIPSTFSVPFKETILKHFSGIIQGIMVFMNERGMTSNRDKNSRNALDAYKHRGQLSPLQKEQNESPKAAIRNHDGLGNCNRNLLLPSHQLIWFFLVALRKNLFHMSPQLLVMHSAP